MSLPLEIFKKQINEKLLQVQAEQSVDDRMKKAIPDIEDYMQREMAQMIVKEIKPHLTIKKNDLSERFRRRPDPSTPSGTSIQDVYSIRVFFMNEDNFLWLMNEYRMLWERVEGRKL